MNYDHTVLVLCGDCEFVMLFAGTLAIQDFISLEVDDVHGKAVIRVFM